MVKGFVILCVLLFGVHYSWWAVHCDQAHMSHKDIPEKRIKHFDAGEYKKCLYMTSEHPDSECNIMLTRKQNGALATQHTTGSGISPISGNDQYDCAQLIQAELSLLHQVQSKQTPWYLNLFWPNLVLPVDVQRTRLSWGGSDGIVTHDPEIVSKALHRQLDALQPLGSLFPSSLVLSHIVVLFL